MIDKKLYIWKLASFLNENNMKMTGIELASHLNTNNITTNYGDHYEGNRGTYKLIQATWRWLNDDLEFADESIKVANSFILPNGEYAWDK